VPAQPRAAEAGEKDIDRGRAEEAPIGVALTRSDARTSRSNGNSTSRPAELLSSTHRASAEDRRNPDTAAAIIA
jgi:hypothetical protein